MYDSSTKRGYGAHVGQHMKAEVSFPKRTASVPPAILGFPPKKVLVNEVAVCQPEGQIAGLPNDFQQLAHLRSGMLGAVSLTHNNIVPKWRNFAGTPCQPSLAGSKLGRSFPAQNDQHRALL